jgi:hypothetical protein
MRRVWALSLAFSLALAFVVMGSGSADAFGSEVLACQVDGAPLTTGACDGGGGYGGEQDFIGYTPLNTSGSYTYKWTIKNQSGGTITAACGTGIIPCLWSGCTATSNVCNVEALTRASMQTFTATLVLTQSGRSRTITAQATIYGWE